MGFEPTIIASWVSIALHAFSARGADVNALCLQSGISPEDLKNPFKPVPISKAIKLWVLAEQEIPNQCLGLEAARCINFTTFHALGYAVMASENLYNAFSRITAYSNAATDVGFAYLDEKPDRFVFGIKINPEAPHIPADCIDMTLGILRFMCRILHDEKPKILELEMARNTLKNKAVFKKVFSENLVLGSQRYAIHFDKAYFLKPIPTGNETIAKANDKFVEELIAKIRNQSITYYVREQIKQRLRNAQDAGIETVAQALAMSERSLQRCLKEENTTFRTLYDLERKNLASDLLIESRDNIITIAHRLGFSDSANFTRAFKRWFNCKPLDFRSNHSVNINH